MMINVYSHVLSLDIVPQYISVNLNADKCVFPGAQSAQSNTLLQAKALAMTAIDVYTDNLLLENIKRQFAERNN